MSAAEKLDFEVGVKPRRSVKREEPVQVAWVDNRLKQWAEQRDDDCGRYAGVNGFGNSALAAVMDAKGDVVRCTAKPGSLMSDGDYQVDEAMRKLAVSDPDLHQVLEVHYCQADADEEVRVKRCRCSRRTYFRRVAKGQAAIAFLLPDGKGKSAGVVSRIASGSRDLLLKKMKKNVDGGVALI